MNDEQKQYTQSADINLRLFDGNPEQWTIAHDKVREAGEKGILLNLNDVLEADNNEELIPVRAEGLHPNLQKVLAENPDRVPTYRDQLQPLSNFAASAEWASLDTESRMKLLQKEYLEKHPAPAGVKRTPAVSYLDVCGAEERAILEKIEETIRSKISVDPSSLEGYLRLTPEGQKTAVATALAHQKKINGVLTALQKDVPDWRNMNATSLAEQIDALRLRYGMDVEGVTPELLREGGAADVDYLQAVNVLGVVDIARAVMAKSPEELAAIDENSSIEDQLALLAYLRRRSQDLRGYGVWGDVVNIAVQSTPFVAEFMLTGGLATVGKVPLKVAVTQALKAGGVEGAKGIATALFRKEGRQALGEAVKAIAVGEAKRSPVMLPKNVAQAWNEYNDGPVVVHGEDGMKLVVPEKRVDEMFTLIARNVVRDYLARTSEWSGEFLPDLNLLSRAIPAGVKNRVVQAFLKGAEADPVKGAMFRRSLFSDVPLSGDIVEFAEEKVNVFMEYVSTQTSHITGAEFLNMGEEDPVGSWRENLTTFLGVALQANAMRAVRTASAVRTVRDLAQLVDDQRSMVDQAEQVPLEQRSVVQSKEFYDRVRGGDRTFYVDTEDARTFFQSDPEFAEACGFTEEAIDRAEERGVMIGVSQNRMIAEQAKSPAMREAGERLLAVVRSSGITINQALSNDVGETVVKAYQEQQERLARYRDKFLSIFEGMEKAGVSKSAIRADSAIVSRILNHLAVGIKEEGKIEEALDALLAEVSRDPEGFAASRPLYLTEVTEDMVQALEEAANAPVVEEAPGNEGNRRRKTEKRAVKLTAAEYTDRVSSNPEQTMHDLEAMDYGDYKALIDEWTSAGHKEFDDAAAVLLMRYMRSAASKVAAKFKDAGADESVLLSIASDQAQKALANFDPSRGALFRTMYTTYFRNGASDYLRELEKENPGKISLNREIGDEGAERQDFIADTGAEAPYAELEAADISEGAKSAVREIMKVLNAPPRTASGERAKAIVSARKVLLRGLLEEKTQQDIAGSLGVTKQAVGQQLSRIREKVIAIAEKHEAPLIDVLKALKELLQNEPNQFEQRGGTLYQVSPVDTPEMEMIRKQFDGTNAYHRAPNGKHSNLTPRQWLQVRTAAFKEWFGDWESAALLNNARKAWNDNNYTFTYRFAPSANLKQKLEDLLGHEVRILQLDGSTVRHIRNHHGSRNEYNRGQRPQTAEDVVTLPYLLNTCDSVEASPEHDTSQGNRALTVYKRINGVAIAGVLEKGPNGIYTVTKWEILSGAPMSRAPGLNVLDGADIENIQRDLAKIKSDAEKSSKVVDENGEPLVVYHGSERHRRLTELDPAKGRNVNALWHASNPHVAMHWGNWRVARFDEKLPERIREASDLKTLASLARNELGIIFSISRNEVSPEDAEAYGVEPGVRYRMDIKYTLAGGEVSEPIPGAKSEADVLNYAKDRLAGYAEEDIQEEHDRNGFTYADFVSLVNPLIVDAKGAPYHQVPFEGRKVTTETLAEYARQNGFDGVIVRNVLETDYEDQKTDDFISLNATQIKSATDNIGTFDPSNPDIRYQQEGILRGATSFGDYFDQNYRAIITLFEGNANASTLVHESAHWLKRLMQSLCEMKGADGEYIADNALREEYNSIEKWLDKQKYESAAGTPEYTIEREEKFARAFEYYIMEGRPPAAEVASAFSTLKEYLRKIYQNLKNMPEFFGFEFSDDIRQVFDSLLTTETILERESPLREAADILRETFAGLLGLNQRETDDIRRLIKLADTQMAAEIDRHKAKLLPKFRKLWKKEAEDAMREMRVYQAWQDVTKKEKSDGRMDTSFLKEEGIPEETIEALRAMGIAVRGGVNPMDTVAKHKYGSLQEMVQDFMENRTPKEFTKDFMAEKEKAFMQNMELDEKTLSVSAVRDLLDKLTEILAVKGGKEGYAIRKGAEQDAALKEIGGTAVRDVAGDKLHLKSLKEHTANLTNAISQKDFLAALEHVEKIRKCMAVLKEKADAKKRITKTREKLMRAVRAPKGAIYADYHEALKELAYYFGYTKRQPEPVKPMEPNYRTRVMEAELNEELSDGYHWPPFLLSNEMRKTDDMVYADFELLADTVDHLYGKGRALVADAKGSFGEKAKSRRASIVEALSKLPAKFHRRRETAKDYVWSAGRSLLHIGENLRVLLGRADGYRHMETGEAGPCLMLRDDILAPAVSDAVRLEVETFRRIKAPLEALWAARDRISLPPSQFRFIGKGLTYGYSKWTPEMVITACLNMGNSVNRDRLVRGFGWQELDLNDLAACIPADLWEHIQAVWDGISGDLQKATAATFLKENYYNMRLVPAEGMTVRYPDGSVHTFKGGYYPIRYAHRAKSKGDAIPSGHSRGLYAEVSSTMMRVQSIAEPDPLDLGLNGIVKHVHETAWYAATRMACREVMAVFRSEEVEYAFGTTQSFEAYDMALNLIRNIANPDALTEGSGGDGGFMDTFERWSKTVMTSGALMMNLSSILKQPASLTVGAQETGEYFLEALNEFSRNPAALTARVKELSPMMSERINYMDPDLRDSALKFGKSEAEMVQSTMMRIGYAAMRFMDGGVAVPVWYAKYSQSLVKHSASGEMDLEEAGRRAVADAEDFVARTQGAGRTIDLTAIQLVRIGRLFSPFITAANAQFNTQIETLGAVRRGKLTGGQALLAIVTNLIAPAIYASAVTALLNGALSDDDDDMDKAIKMGLQEMIVSPVSGYPLVRDAAQYMAGSVLDTALGGKKGYRPEVFEVSAFDAVSKVVGGAIDASDAALEGNWSRAAWKAADSIGSAFKVPAIRIYERATKQYKRTFGELPDVLERLEESTKTRKGKK